MEKHSLKTQFLITFALILGLSILATAVTYLIALVGYAMIQSNRITPANFYENQLPTIEQGLHTLGAGLLDPARRPEMEALVPQAGMRYQVLGADGGLVYGSETRPALSNRDDLYARINTTFPIGDSFVRLVPVIDTNERIAGAVALWYQLTPTFSTQWDRIWITLAFGAALLSPFFYVVLFTFLLARRFVGRITYPLNLLTEAASKICTRDLDFEIPYRAPNELGRLCAAFDEMRLELSRSLEAQWQMEQERTEMVEALAHDLKTPLSIIQGYTEALQEGGLARSDHSDAYLAVIHDNTNKVAHQVAQLQFITDLEDTGGRMEIQPVDQEAFLGEKLEEYRLLARPNKVKVDLHLEDGRLVGGPVYFDREKLERILDNLVLNALNYSPSGGSVDVWVHIISQRLSCSVCDSGPGFSKQDLAHLFDRFYRGDAARSTNSGHSGLGLYIARQLAEKHGGAIRASNRPEGGACVTFDIALGQTEG